MAAQKIPREVRFWAKVRKETIPFREGLTPCWVWLANKTHNGYGQFDWPPYSGRSHRISWILHFGDIPDGLCVLHKCDNPPCVNPEHLFLGTRQDNHDDMWAKGRGWSKNGRHSDPAQYRTISRKHKAIGEDHPLAKLTKERVLAIRHAHDVLRVPQAQLAKEHGVDRATIRDVVLRRSWAHV